MNRFMTDAVAGGIGGAALTLPMNLIAGQGLQQALINSGLAGVAAAVGGGVGGGIPGAGQAGSGVGSTAGMLVGNALGNQLGMDRNEQAIAALGTSLYDTQLNQEQQYLQQAIADQAIQEALQLLSSTKREKFNEAMGNAVLQIQPGMMAIEGNRLPVEQMPTNEELLMAQAVLQSTLNNPQVRIAV